jgi:hypothetical protein
MQRLRAPRSARRWNAHRSDNGLDGLGLVQLAGFLILFSVMIAMHFDYRHGVALPLKPTREGSRIFVLDNPRAPNCIKDGPVEILVVLRRVGALAAVADPVRHSA